MAFQVFLTDHAVRDLEDIHRYISERDAPLKADHVIERIGNSLDSLAESPLRGAYPKELLSIGIREYREVYFKPYRIIYRVMEKKVYVMLVADGRRDMQDLLQRRLISAP